MTATAPPTPKQERKVLFTLFGLQCHKPRGPRQYFNEITAGQALFPLIVLFGLNAVDELDRTAFGVLGPDIRDHFGLSNQQLFSLISLTLLAGLLLEVPLGYYADRLPRMRVAVLGALIWTIFGGATGLSTTVLFLIIVRSGAGMGRAVVNPTHSSLLPDLYPPEVRADVFGFHRLGNAIGQFIGPLMAGLLAYWFDWRVPFFVFVPICLVFVILGFRLKDPGRGHFERERAGAHATVVGVDEVPPSFAESIRILWNVQTLRRIWVSLPFLAASIIGLLAVGSIYYEEVWNLDSAQRGIVAAAAEPAGVVGIMIGIPLASRMMLRDPAQGLRLLAIFGVIIGGCWVAFALAPVLGIAIAMNILISAIGAVLTPGVYATLSLCIPPKVRSLGFAMASVFVLPGLVVLILVGSLADRYGPRTALLAMAPVFLIGAWILSSASFYVKSDINRVWTSTAAQAEVKLKREQGEVKLLLVRNIDVHYDGVQVLFGVNFEVDEGEIVALLGTNGAGKSTLLKAISGLVEATNGAVVFDGRDMTYAPPNETAERGVVLFPGGQGVFPTLSVGEHLRLASWMHRKDKQRVKEATDHVLELFPVLRDRLDEPAGNLSGGQQQMLALGMAFIEKPRLLMIDELSLGLAPAIVEQLLPIVRDIGAQGTTIILVEQSVNLALTIAETAYFMEKGEIRFHGPTEELLNRPDVLRSVFLEGAATNAAEAREEAEEAPKPTVAATVAHVAGPKGNGHTPPPVRLGLDGVTKRFGGLAALSDVTYQAHAGEILGFIGPNGAGKTTMFDVISGFLAADQGTIILGEGDNAVDVTKLSAAARSKLGLGRSFQDGRLFPNLTVAETISIAYERHLEARDPIAAALRLPWMEETEHQVHHNVEQLLELLGITDFRDKLVRELSTGSRRIVDLACVVAHGPSVLLLDEPSSGIAQREAEALGSCRHGRHR